MHMEGYDSSTVVTLYRPDSLQVRVDVRYENLAQVRLGQPVRIASPALENELSGKVLFVSSLADIQKNTLQVKVEMDTPPSVFKPEMLVDVTFLAPERTGNRPRRPHCGSSFRRNSCTRTITARSSGWPISPRGERGISRFPRGSWPPTVWLKSRVAWSFRNASLPVGANLCGTATVLKSPARVQSLRRVADRMPVRPRSALVRRAVIKTGMWAGSLHHMCRLLRPQGETAAMALVEITEVTKRYHKGGQTITPLDRVSLDVLEGEFVSLMGASGSGKSTLLNLIASIDRPDSGSIVVRGTDITRLSRTRLARWRSANIGYVFQTHNLIPVLTAYENVELPLLLLPMSRAERRKRIEVALQAVDLTDRADHYPRQLSGGQEQRVGIARAIVAHPTVVVADEPTGDLDPETSEQILDLLQRLNRQLGMTLLMVTHDPEAAASRPAPSPGPWSRDSNGRCSAQDGYLTRFHEDEDRLPTIRMPFKFAPYILKTLWRHRAAAC